MAFALAASILIFALSVRPNNPDPEKNSPYECGMPP